MLILLCLSSSTIAQEKKILKNEFGINLTRNELDDRAWSIRYRRFIEDAGSIKLEFNTKFQGVYNWRFGYEFYRYKVKSLESSLGLDILYRTENLRRFGWDDTRRTIGIELPMEVRIYIVKQLHVNIGISLFRKLRSSGYEGRSFNGVSEVRIGTGFQF